MLGHDSLTSLATMSGDGSGEEGDDDGHDAEEGDDDEGQTGSDGGEDSAEDGSRMFLTGEEAERLVEEQLNQVLRRSGALNMGT